MSDHIDRAAELIAPALRAIWEADASWNPEARDIARALDAAGLLRRPNDPEVHVEVTTQGSTCVVKVAGQVVFNGVSREHAILTPSGVKHDAAVAAEALREATGRLDDQPSARMPFTPEHERDFADGKDAAAEQMADDLPGEPVEPSDLRAGDRVAFTWVSTGERIICALVDKDDGDFLRSDAPDSGNFLPNVVFRGKWCHGVSDVRLLKRAPREDDDEALRARVAAILATSRRHSTPCSIHLPKENRNDHA